MSRQTCRFVISVFVFIVAASTVLGAPAPAEQSRTTLRPSTDREVLSRFSPESIAAFRQQLVSILQREYDVIAASGQVNAQAMMDSKMKIVANASDADLARLMNAGVDLAPLDASVERVHSWVQKNRELAVSSRLGNPTVNSTGFPSAQYSFCGSTRNAAEGMFAAEVVLEVAKGVWSAASRACDEVVVILGEGGNVSLVCIITDAVLAAAEGVFNGFQFCDADIDSAEIEGSYDRLGHIHTDLSDARTAIVNNDNSNTSTITANDNSNKIAIINNDNTNKNTIVSNDNTNTASIIANDNSNRILVITNANSNTTTIMNNDNSNRDILIGELRMISCEIIRLLNTPEGQRSSNLASCAGQPNFPYEFPEKKLQQTAGTVDSTISMMPAFAFARPADRQDDNVTMETNLLAGKVIASYYLPASRGGQLERVKDLVWNTLGSQTELKIAVDKLPAARSEAESADQLLQAGQYVDAYRHYASAYQKMVPSF